jgi:hypothetical protein
MMKTPLAQEPVGQTLWTACSNRQKHTRELTEQEYAGTILATPESCPTLRPH